MKTFRKIVSVLTILVGLIVICLGSTLLEVTDSHAVGTGNTSISAGRHPVSSASFGADFYTYIYKAAYSVALGMDDVQQSLESSVDVMNNVRKEVAGNTRAVDDMIRLSSKTGAYTVMAIGLFILVYGLQCTANAFQEVHVIVDRDAVPESSTAAAILEVQNAPEAEKLNSEEAPEEPAEETDA